MSLQDAIKQQKQQQSGNQSEMQSALADAAKAASQTDTTAGAGNTNTSGGTTSSGVPITYSALDLDQRVKQVSADERERRQRNSNSQVLRVAAKTPNNYAVAEELYPNQQFTPHESSVKAAVGLSSDAKFPLKKPKTMNYSTDGYEVALVQDDGTVAPPKVLSKSNVGKWIRENALMRIGTEEKGVRIRERSTLTNSAYLVSHWGFKLNHGSNDIIETFEKDGEEFTERSLNLAPDKVYEDASGVEVKIKARVALPSYKRKEEYEQELGPLTIKNRGPLNTPHEIDAALRSLAKIAIAEDKLKSMQM